VPNFDSIAIMPHAKKRLAERNAQEADATATICNPDVRTFQRKGTQGGKVYLHSKKIGDAKLFVVAEIVAKRAFIVTVFWENDQEP
jgi:hypothetical protein